MRVLFDGWQLADRPDGAAALHLLSVLAHLTHPVQAILALPVKTDALESAPEAVLPPGVEIVAAALSELPRGRLEWEQRTLPRLAQEREAALVHLVTATPALFGRLPCLVSPAASSDEQERGSILERLREALARGGMSRGTSLLWPEDLQAFLPQDMRARARLIPAAIYPGFFELAGGDEPGLELPETFILYHGPCDTHSLVRLFDSWSWAAGPLGEYYPLLVLGAGETGRRRFAALAPGYSVGESIRLLPPLAAQQVPGLYRRCQAVFHPAPLTPWENPLRLALAVGKPFIGMESDFADALAGPAAYLVPGQGARILGAALITVVVEEAVREALELAARQRSAAWRPAERGAEFSRQLLEVYRELARPAG